MSDPPSTWSALVTPTIKTVLIFTAVARNQLLRPVEQRSFTDIRNKKNCLGMKFLIIILLAKCEIRKNCNSITVKIILNIRGVFKK